MIYPKKTSQVAPRYLTGFLFFHGISILGFQRVTLQLFYLKT